MTEKEAHVTQVTVTFPDDVSHNGVCEARTPNEESCQLPSTGTVMPPEKAQLRIRTNSINGTRKYSFLAGPSFLLGETSLGGLDISVSDIDHPSRRGSQSSPMTLVLTFIPARRCVVFEFETLVLTF